MSLENSWSISEPERHNEVFKVTQWSVERRLPFVPLPDANQMWSEDGGLVKRSEGRVEKRKRVLVFDRDVVYSPVVHTGAQGFVLLLYKEEPCSHGRGRGTNEAVRQ